MPFVLHPNMYLFNLFHLCNRFGLQTITIFFSFTSIRNDIPTINSKHFFMSQIVKVKKKCSIDNTFVVVGVVIITVVLLLFCFILFFLGVAVVLI